MIRINTNSKETAQFAFGGLGSSPAVVIEYPGNVGIGTSSPGYRLDVDAGGDGIVGNNAALLGLRVDGTFTASGTKAATVETPSFGKRKLYAVESPTVRFTDEGEAKLTNGTARIELDPVFAETIEGKILVQVTPKGPESLYVAKEETNFRVERFVASPLPHRPVRATFPHTVLLITISLFDSNDKFWALSKVSILWLDCQTYPNPIYVYHLCD